MKRVILFSFVGFFLICSCGESDPLEEQLSSWRKAGLETTPFESTAPNKLGAVSCFAGNVSGIHVTLCDYPDAAATEQATQAGHRTIGNATGLALARGQVLLVAVDRDNVDPQGQTINKISRTFWGEKD